MAAHELTKMFELGDERVVVRCFDARLRQGLMPAGRRGVAILPECHGWKCERAVRSEEMITVLRIVGIDGIFAAGEFI